MLDNPPSRAETYAGIGTALLAIVLLFVAIYGSPPYAFFTLLRWVVVGAKLYLAYLCLRSTKAWFLPALPLVALAGIQMFASMRREDWVFFNWGSIAALSTASILLLILHLNETSHPKPS